MDPADTNENLCPYRLFYGSRLNEDELAQLNITEHMWKQATKRINQKSRKLIPQEVETSQALLAHTYNPSYLGG
jgi:hypothetical protein